MIPDRVVHEDDPNGDVRPDVVNASEKRNSYEPSNFRRKNIRDENHVSSNKSNNVEAYSEKRVNSEKRKTKYDEDDARSRLPTSRPRRGTRKSGSSSLLLR